MKTVLIALVASVSFTPITQTYAAESGGEYTYCSVIEEYDKFRAMLENNSIVLLRTKTRGIIGGALKAHAEALLESGYPIYPSEIFVWSNIMEYTDQEELIIPFWETARKKGWEEAEEFARSPCHSTS